MTSTGTYKGLQDGRNSSKVLKPPGGGSSDIFGPESGSTPRKTKVNANQSQLSHGFFGTEEVDNHHHGASSGPPPMINGGGGSSISVSSGSAPDTPRSTTSSSGAGIGNGGSKPDGNPVTGTGYEAMQHNGGGGSTGSSIAGSDKSSTDSSPSMAPAPRMKNRVPPGGFSSGLW